MGLIEAWRIAREINKAWKDHKAAKEALQAAHDKMMYNAGWQVGFETCLGIVAVILLLIGIFKLATRRSKVSSGPV